MNRAINLTLSRLVFFISFLIFSLHSILYSLLSKLKKTKENKNKGVHSSSSWIRQTELFLAIFFYSHIFFVHFPFVSISRLKKNQEHFKKKINKKINTSEFIRPSCVRQTDFFFRFFLIISSYSFLLSPPTPLYWKKNRNT